MLQPLEDIRILDLTRLLPGGFASQWLADFGADVIKVEDTGAGDYIRFAPPYYEAAPGEDEAEIVSTRSALYLSLNRSKRSIRIDLKSDAGREAFLRLVESADVVLEGFRPGVMDRLGVGYETLHEINPGLVYCAITGYGQDGPKRDRAGHDLNYLGSTGLLGLTGQKDGPPIQPAAQIGDLGGGAMAAAFGVMTALFAKQRTGEGQMVDISMTDGAMSWLAMLAGAHFADGDVPQRGELMLGGGIVCYMPYEAADGWVSCGALEPKFWKAFCEGIDMRHLIEHQFDPPGGPGWTKVAEIFKSKTRAEWEAFNDEHNCCIEPILDVKEALESDLARERGMVVEIDQPGIGPVRQVGNPIKLSGTPAGDPRPAPVAGADTADVLAEAGLSQEEIAALLEAGAAAGPGGGTSSEGIGFRA
ncbi:MAG: CoA transferase [Thermoleophilia bacterium]|nr:CoA transferase [Thermoleophilia bacterium]